jgi:hypothetical protein
VRNEALHPHKTRNITITFILISASLTAKGKTNDSVSNTSVYAAFTCKKSLTHYNMTKKSRQEKCRQCLKKPFDISDNDFMIDSERKGTVAYFVNEINLCGYPHVILEEERNLVRAVVLPVRGERGNKSTGYALKY